MWALLLVQYHVPQTLDTVGVLQRQWPGLYQTVQRPAAWLQDWRMASHDDAGWAEAYESLEKKWSLLQARTQQLEALVAENHTLKTLMYRYEDQMPDLVLARTIQTVGRTAGAWFWLDRGAQEGLQVGQAVVDEAGLLGLVSSVAPSTAQVALLVAPSMMLPVELPRSGLQTLAHGQGPQGTLKAEHVPQNIEFLEGDEVVTSGNGGLLPAGLAVGRVTQVVQRSEDVFQTLVITPYRLQQQSRFVVVLTGALS